MCVKRYCVIQFLLLFCFVMYSKESSTDRSVSFRTGGDIVRMDTLANGIRINKQYKNIEVHFKFDKYDLDLDYMGNRSSLQNFAHVIDSVGISRIDSIVIVSQSSPEGVYEYNLKLSRNRANTMRKYIVDNYPELSGLLYVYPDGESWARLREYVRKDTLMKTSTIEKVISIIDADINVGTKKWRMEQLPVYRYLLKTYYPKIRNSTFCILYYSERESQVVDPVNEIQAKAEITSMPAIERPIVPTVEEWIPKLYLKTNAIPLIIGISNIAVEVDVARHWSVTLPVYYSAWNYFKSTVKFRTFTIQPELRYWLSDSNDGFFAGLHPELAYYNFAIDGDYRYQDHKCKTPAIGGGVSFGYRLPISRNNRWKLELSLGAGFYGLHYDKFHNTSDTKEGLRIETVTDTYLGIDQANISVSYMFDLKKSGGRR